MILPKCKLCDDVRFSLKGLLAQPIQESEFFPGVVPHLREDLRNVRAPSARCEIERRTGRGIDQLTHLIGGKVLLKSRKVAFRLENREHIRCQRSRQGGNQTLLTNYRPVAQHLLERSIHCVVQRDVQERLL